MSFFEKFGRSAGELKTIRCITVTGVLIALDLVLKMLSIKITADLKITFAFIALATIGMLFGPTVSFLAGVITDIIGYMLNSDGGFSPLFTVVEAVGAMIYGIFLYGIKPVGISVFKKDRPLSFYLSSIGRGILYGIICAEVMSLILCVSGVAIFPAMYGDSNMGKIAKVILNEPLLYSALGIGFIYGMFFTLLISVTVKDENENRNVRASMRVIISKITVVVVCNIIMTPIAMVLSAYTTVDAMIAGLPLRIVKNAVQCPIDCLILLIMLFPILAAYKKIFPVNETKKKLDRSIVND